MTKSPGHRRSMVVAATLCAALLSGCTADHPEPAAHRSVPSATTSSQQDLTDAKRVGPDTGRPLAEIDADRPTNSRGVQEPSMATYKREGGICSVKRSQIDCSKVPADRQDEAKRLWARTEAFFPPAVRNKMTTFVLLPTGQGGGVAEGRAGGYTFSVGPPRTGNVDHIIVHELGHGFEVTTQKAFAASWKRKFWSRADTKKANRFLADDSAAMETNPVYVASPDRFVHPYAASSSSEDFAETFRWFVLGVRPSGDTVKEQKILSLWSVPELVSARTRIQRAMLAQP